MGILTAVMPIQDDGRYTEALLRYWRPLLEAGVGSCDVTFLLMDESISPRPVAALAGRLEDSGFAARVHRSSPPRGPGHARQAGLQAVATDYVCFLDVDDRPDLGRLVSAARFARDRRVDVMALGHRIERHGEVFEEDKSPNQAHFWEDALSRRVGVWRFVFSVDFLQRNGASFPSWSYAEDLAFLLQCAAADPKTQHFPGVAYTYLQHGGGLSGRRPSEDQALQAIAWLHEFGARSRDPAVRYLCALWLSRIAIRGGWRTAPHAAYSLRELVRRPGRVLELASGPLRERLRRRPPATKASP